MCVWSISPHLTCFICLINTSDYSCWTDGLYMCDLSYCPAVVLVSVWLLIVVFVGQWCCRRSVIWSCMTSLTAPCVRAGGRQKGLLGTWSCTRHWQRASPRTRRRWKIHTHTTGPHTAYECPAWRFGQKSRVEQAGMQMLSDLWISLTSWQCWG